MQPVLGSAWLAAVVLALLMISGCAQPPGSSSGAAPETRSGTGSGTSGQLNALLAMTPVDHWETGVEKNGQAVVYANAGTVTAARDAVLLLGCTSDEKTIVLMITPQQGLPIDPSIRPVTITLDGDTTLTQDWQSSAASYWSGDFDPAFAALLQSLKTHKDVEFVLGGPGREIDRRRFNLNGADKAIEHVISNCAKKV